MINCTLRCSGSSREEKLERLLSKRRKDNLSCGKVYLPYKIGICISWTQTSTMVGSDIITIRETMKETAAMLVEGVK